MVSVIRHTNYCNWILRNRVRIDIAAINVEFAIYQRSLMPVTTTEILDWVLRCL